MKLEIRRARNSDIKEILKIFLILLSIALLSSILIIKIFVWEIYANTVIA